MTRPGTTRPTSAPGTSSSAPQSFESKRAGFRLQYPADWKPKSSKDDVLLLIPAQNAGIRNISMDEPELPGHIPGMIPLHLVQNGYVDDMRKKHAGLKVESQGEKTVAGAKGRFVRTTWQENGTTLHEDAVLVVHGDHVYILSLDSDNGHYPLDQQTLEQIGSSVTWEK